MLTGIKVGKRKRSAPSSGSNQSTAEVLRASLLSSSGGDGQCTTSSSSNDGTRNDDDAAAIRALHDRGRISKDVVIANHSRNDDKLIVINRSNTDSTTTSNSNIFQRETELGVRYNSRGKLSLHSHEQSRNKTDLEMTITEMASHEKSSGNTSNMDDIYAHNILKMGHKGYKRLSKMMGNNSHSGADEEDYLQESSLSTNLYRSNDDKLSPAELAKRSTSRQISHHDAVTKWTARSSWWMESPSFDKQYLLALGEKISLVMTPSHKRLQQHQQHQKKGSTTSSSWVGGQCMIVPIAYCESFAGLDEDAWDEVKRFQLSLCHMFHSEGRGVIFLETVERTSQSASGGVGGGGGGGMTTQARMDVIPVPLAIERDAQLYFRSALAEVAQEWGTHQRPIDLEEVGRRGGKNVRNSVPRRGFPYFYCGWGEGSVNNCESDTIRGYVQLIENEDGKRFQLSGLDVIAGMMGCDPMRFQRKSPSLDRDREELLRFCNGWQKYDWTLELDG